MTKLEKKITHQRYLSIFNEFGPEIRSFGNRLLRANCRVPHHYIRSSICNAYIYMHIYTAT